MPAPRDFALRREQGLSYQAQFYQAQLFLLSAACNDTATIAVKFTVIVAGTSSRSAAFINRRYQRW